MANANGPFAVLKKSSSAKKVNTIQKLRGPNCYNTYKSKKPLYKCYIQNCNHHFIQPISLRRHLRMHFPQFDRFQCIHCPISFHKYSTLMVHLKSHSSDGKVLRKSLFQIQKRSVDKSLIVNSSTPSLNDSLITTCNINDKCEAKEVSTSDGSNYFDLLQSLNDLYNFSQRNSGNFYSSKIFEAVSQIFHD